MPVVLDRGSLPPAAPTTPSSPANGPAPSLDLRPLADPQPPAEPLGRPQPPVPDPRPIVRNVAPPAPPPTRTLARHHSISGRASWYCNYDDPSVPRSACHYAYPDGPGFDGYAAAGPGLRAAIGAGWRNDVVLVCGRRCVQVKLVDWCKCTGGSVGVVKLIDLYEDVYERTGGNITISW